jgi:hypothetical protein
LIGIVGGVEPDPLQKEPIMRNRAVVITVAGITTLLIGGTGLALASTPAPDTAAPAVPVVSAPGLVTPAGATTTGQAPASEPRITAEEAESIALARVGAGRVTEIEREFEHGRAEWKVEIVEGGREHDVRVDANSGVITRTEVDDRD